MAGEIHLLMIEHDMGERFWCAEGTAAGKYAYKEVPAVYPTQLHKVDCKDCLYALMRAGKKAEEYWYGLP
jgi:hypothetical protein